MMDIRSEKQDMDNLRMTFEVAKASLDPSTKVGGILLLKDGRRVPTYNAFMTLEDHDVPLVSREHRYADVLHAEERVLLELGSDRAEGGWYYGTHEPCGRCWKLLDMMGIQRVVFLTTSDDRRERWGCDTEGAQIARRRIQRRHPNAIVEVAAL